MNVKARNGIKIFRHGIPNDEKSEEGKKRQLKK